MVPVSLVLNAGSSSIKFQLFEAGGVAEPRRIYRGLFDGLGSSPHFMVRNQAGEIAGEMRWGEAEPFGHERPSLIWPPGSARTGGDYRLEAVGHRVVHGGVSFSTPVLIDQHVLRELEQLVPLAPLHQPHNLAPIRILRERFPDLPQIACFDTAFHRNQPDLAQLFALPRSMTEAGVRRYGFHGLSYAYIASVLAHYDPGLASGRVVVASSGQRCQPVCA